MPEPRERGAPRRADRGKSPAGRSDRPAPAENPFVGFRKTSLLDYPGLVSSVLFFPGCNFRCPWCHNPELVLGGAADLLPLADCLREIGRRKRLVQGVAITGGEPFLRDLLGDQDTRPDYLALDLKTGTARYRELAAAPGLDAASAARKSVGLLAESGLAFEFRTVVAPGYMDEDIVAELAAIVPDGAPWYFSPFSPGNCLDPTWNDRSPPPPGLVSALARRARELGKNAMTR
jgi:pyruvate formate lyase activating enzyme